MIQIVAVLSHSIANKLGPQWKHGRCNGYTQTVVRVCASEEEAGLAALTLPGGSIWTVEAAGA